MQDQSANALTFTLWMELLSMLRSGFLAKRRSVTPERYAS